MIQPLHNYIAVKPDPSLHEMFHVKAENKIITSQEQIAHTGTIVACGPGAWEKKRFIPMTVIPGQRIRFGEWEYPKVDTDDGQLWIISEKDIIGVIDEA